MRSCVEGDFGSEDVLSEEEDLPGIVDYMKQVSSELTYTLGKAEVNEDKARVPVTVEFTDITDVMKAALGNYIAKIFTVMFSDVPEEEVEKMFEDCLTEAIANNETKRATEEMTMDMALVGEEWKITEVPDAMLNIMSGNLLNALSDLDNLFGEGEDWSGGAEPVEYPIANEVIFDNDQASMTIVSGGSDEWGVTLFPGQQTMTDISFSSEDLENNGIEEVDSIELKLKAMDTEAWEDIFNETVTLKP